MSKEVAKNTKSNKLNKKVNNLEKKIPDVSTLAHTSRYKADEQNLEKKNWVC